MDKTTDTTLETRYFDIQDMEVRAGEGNQPAHLTGYAIRWNDLSNDLGGFKEKAVKGAFSKSLSSGQDIRALVHHDPDKLLGRTKNGTMSVSEDDIGLKYDVTLPDTSYANDLRTLVKRGDIKGLSIGFSIPKGGDSFSKEGGQTIRTLNNVDLREISAVATPAYGSTSLSVRVDPSVIRQIQQADTRPRYTKSVAKLRLSGNHQ